jgi:hypothetical protein
MAGQRGPGGAWQRLASASGSLSHPLTLADGSGAGGALSLDALLGAPPDRAVVGPFSTPLLTLSAP